MKKRRRNMSASKLPFWGILLAIAVNLLLQPVLAMLTVKGILQESTGLTAQFVVVGLAGWLGSVVFGRRSSLGPAGHALVVAAGLCIFLLLMGWTVCDGVVWCAHSIGILVSVWVGCLISVPFTAGGGKHPKRKKYKRTKQKA